MDLFNVGPWELIVVLVIAILVAGPKRMVEIAGTLGRMSRQLRDLSREFTTALQAEIQATERETARAGTDLREVREDVEGMLAGSAEAEPERTEEAGTASSSADTRAEGE
ncbi:MAG: twin-arginine translocase TatA/TatE family subunit [Anaerolineae bacterium]